MSFPLLPTSWAHYPLKYRTATAALVPGPTSPGYHVPSVLGRAAFVPNATFNPVNGGGQVSFAPARFGKNYAFVLATFGTLPPIP